MKRSQYEHTRTIQQLEPQVKMSSFCLLLMLINNTLVMWWYNFFEG